MLALEKEASCFVCAINSLRDGIQRYVQWDVSISSTWTRVNSRNHVTHHEQRSPANWFRNVGVMQSRRAVCESE